MVTHTEDGMSPKQPQTNCFTTRELNKLKISLGVVPNGRKMALFQFQNTLMSLIDDIRWFTVTSHSNIEYIPFCFLQNHSNTEDMGTGL